MDQQNYSKSISDVVQKVAEPIAEKLGFNIWNVKFVKEGPNYYLRIFIDNDKGITIEDCEKMSKAIEGPIDELDPISQNYYLEVCSPGVERELTKDKHFEQFIGHKIIVRLIRPSLIENIHQIKGVLLSHSKDKICLLDSEKNTISIFKKDIAFVKLDDFNDFND